jgi:hypothetical protein
MKLFAILLATLISATSFASGDAHAPLFPQPQADANKTTKPGAVKLVEPKNFSAHIGDKALLKWEAVELADLYYVQVAKDPNFKWLIAENVASKETQIEVAGLEKGKHYYWRVLGYKSSNDPSYMKGPWSTSMFETK